MEEVCSFLKEEWDSLLRQAADYKRSNTFNVSITVWAYVCYWVKSS